MRHFSSVFLPLCSRRSQLTLLQKFRLLQILEQIFLYNEKLTLLKLAGIVIALVEVYLASVKMETKIQDKTIETHIKSLKGLKSIDIGCAADYKRGLK